MISEANRTRLRSNLAAAFGRRLKGAVIFGSCARGTAGPDSDLDVLVLLEGPIRLGPDLRTAVDALYPLHLELDRCIHPLPADFEAFQAGECALYRNVFRDGLAA